jgi:hypothetical protein
MAKGRARRPNGTGLALFKIWRRCWSGEQGDQEGQEGQRCGDIFDTLAGFGAGAGMVSSGAGGSERSDGLAVFQKPERELEGGQVGGWPPSRNPHRCWKAAKAAKAANVVVTVMTELTHLTHDE